MKNKIIEELGNLTDSDWQDIEEYTPFEYNNNVSWYADIYYRLWNMISSFPRNVKYLFQKVFRGYSDLDIWSLSNHLSKIIYKRLLVFKNTKRNAIPMSVYEYGISDDALSYRWESILDKMIYAFYMLVEDDNWKSNINIDTSNYLEVKEGLELFAKHFQDLWD